MQDLQELVIDVAWEYRADLETKEIVELLEQHMCYQGMYTYLKTMVDNT